MPTLLRGVPQNFEPKLQNRFYIDFPQELDIPTWLVQTSGYPKIDIEATKIPFFNSESYVSSRYTWGTIDIKFIDPIGPSTTQKLMEWVRLHAESLTGRMGYANGYLKDLIINTVDPTGVTIEQWKLYQCLITKSEFGEGDYSGGELKMATLTIQPRFAELSY